MSPSAQRAGPRWLPRPLLVAEGGGDREVGGLVRARGGDQPEPVLVGGLAGSLILPAVEVEATDPARVPGVGDGLGQIGALRRLADSVRPAGRRADLGDPDLLAAVPVAGHDAADRRPRL